MSTFMISLQSENQKLKTDVQRLTGELEERDKLITSLECQIRALLAEQPNLTAARARHGSGNGTTMSGGHAQRRPSPSLMPPSRSTVEMQSPLAPEADKEGETKKDEERRHEEKEEKEGEPPEESAPKTHEQTNKKVVVSVIKEEPSDANSSEGSDKKTLENNKESAEHRPSLKAGLKSSRGVLKNLPREISIANDDDDEVTKYSLEESPTFEAAKASLTDAYNAKGEYTGTVARKENLPHGKGLMVYYDQTSKVYEGDWHLGHWHGKGTIQTSDGDYTGDVVNDLKEGSGLMVYADGHKFEGTFKQDKPVEGTLTYVDQKQYVGQLKNGKWHGKGTLSYPDGSKYTGEFHSGVQHGQGIYNFSDGSVYDGESVMGAYEGMGKMTWADGGWYEGEWTQGEANGHGMEIRPDGRLRHHGKWRKGVPVRT